jgi:hypothetical protein
MYRKGFGNDTKNVNKRALEVKKGVETGADQENLAVKKTRHTKK